MKMGKQHAGQGNGVCRGWGEKAASASARDQEKGELCVLEPRT